MAEGGPPDPRTLARGGALAFLAAAATLLLQVLVHRMVSAKLLNNYAFLVISLTMLGLAFSGGARTRLAPRSHPDPGSQFPGTTEGYVRDPARRLPAALLFAVPFAFAGLMLGALLS